MNRALRAATVGVLLLSPVALSACSAGQVTQTASQDRDKVGPSARVGDLLLRQVTLAYPDNPEHRYERGEDAELRAAIVNGSNEPDALVGIEGEAFRGVEVTGTATPAPADPGSPSPVPTEAAPAAEPPADASPTTDGTPAATTPAATTPATPSPTGGSAGSEVDLALPPRSTVFLGSDDGVSVVLTGLTEELTAGQYIELTMTFQRAGEVTVPVMVGNPEDELPRGEGFDFHHEEASREEDQDHEVAGGGNPESGG